MNKLYCCRNSNKTKFEKRGWIKKKKKSHEVSKKLVENVSEILTGFLVSFRGLLGSI